LFLQKLKIQKKKKSIYKREEYYQAFISQMKSFSVSTDRQKKDDVFDAAVAISEINGESSNV